MSKYEFKYHSLQKITAIYEKQLSGEIAELENQKADLVELLLLKKKELSLHKIDIQGKMSLHDLRLFLNFKVEIENQIIELENKLDEQNKLLNLKVIELEKRAKESKIISKLDEKYLFRFNNKEKHEEMKLMNELAVSGYNKEKNEKQDHL